MQIIQTDTAPKAVGPYAQAIQAGNLIFTSGQIPIDPRTGNMTPADIAAQTEQIIQNLSAILHRLQAAVWIR